MSRSHRKSPCVTVIGRSNKKDKRFVNRAFRRMERTNTGTDRYLPERTREIRDVYDFTSDGLTFWDDTLPSELMRK